MTRTRFPAALANLEMQCKLRVSDGATAEIGFHAGDDRSIRLYFAPGVVKLLVYEGGRLVANRLAVGPCTALSEGLAEALSAELEGRSLHPLARALLDRNLAPALEQVLKVGVPSAGIQRTRQRILLGSFVAAAIDRFGLARYRDLHFDELASAKTPLGELAELDEAWKAALRALRRSPDEAREADRTLGLDVFTDAATWRDLRAALRERKFATSGGGRFAVDRDGLEWQGGIGVSAGRASVPEAAPVRGALRAIVRLAEGSRARLKLIARDGKESAALIAPSGAALVTPDATVAARSDFPLDTGRWYDVTLVLDNGAGRLYLDGRLVAEARGLAVGPGKWVIECEGARAEVFTVALRSL
jgi:hypothetical protein